MQTIKKIKRGKERKKRKEMEKTQISDSVRDVAARVLALICAGEVAKPFRARLNFFFSFSSPHPKKPQKPESAQRPFLFFFFFLLFLKKKEESGK